MSKLNRVFILKALVAGMLVPLTWLSAQSVKPPQTPRNDQAASVADLRPRLSARFAATRDDTLFNVVTPGAKLDGAEIVAYKGPGIGGRGISVFAPGVSLTNMVFRAGNDDALGFVGDTHGAIVVNCQFPCDDWGAAKSKALIAYTNPKRSNQPGPTYGHDVGYAAKFIDCFFGGGAIRLNDGVREFERCRFVVNALYGIDLTDAECNFIGCEWIVILEMPRGATYWMQRNKDGSYQPCPIRVAGWNNGVRTDKPIKSRLYFSNCRIRTYKTWADYTAGGPSTVAPADGPDLVRCYPTEASAKAGWTAYQPDGQGVPSDVFQKKPI